MKNFTKSVLYSTTIVAAGLVAAFAIYSNVAGNQDSSMSIASISPASGASDIGVNFGEDPYDMGTAMAKDMGAIIESAENVAQNSVSSAVDMMQDTAKALNEMATAAGHEAHEEASDKVEDAAHEAKDMVHEAKENVHKSGEDVKDHAGDHSEKSGDESHEKDAHASEDETKSY